EPGEERHLRFGRDLVPARKEGLRRKKLSQLVLISGGRDSEPSKDGRRDCLLPFRRKASHHSPDGGRAFFRAADGRLKDVLGIRFADNGLQLLDSSMSRAREGVRAFRGA